MKNAIIPFLLILFVSCQQVTFDKPQPEGVKELRELPEKLWGEYISDKGHCKLYIDVNSILCTYEYEVACHKDSAMRQEFCNPPIRSEGDTLVYLVNYTDSLFRVSDNNVMKKYKGYYFMSLRETTNSWVVSKIKLKKGKLTISNIATKDEIDLLEKINESPLDSSSMNLSFTRKQFRRFIDEEGFSDEETFTKTGK